MHCQIGKSHGEITEGLHPSRQAGSQHRLRNSITSVIVLFSDSDRPSMRSLVAMRGSIRNDDVFYHSLPELASGGGLEATCSKMGAYSSSGWLGDFVGNTS